MRTIFLFTIIFFSCSKNNSILESYFGDNNTLDIITWNIENFPKHDNTVSLVSETIINLNPDIIALQEIESHNDFEKLIDNLGPPWQGYRSDNSDYGELSYLINTNTIEIIEGPNQILENDSYYFAYREPYVLEFLYNQNPYIIINVHYKAMGDGLIDFYDENDEEYRRYQASILLEEYVSENHEYSNVIITGDFNDELKDDSDHNIFNPFLERPLKYKFTDYQIEINNDISFFSYPTWPSHLDHILISNELYENWILTETIRIEDQMINGWDDYESFISDHRPVGIKIY